LLHLIEIHILYSKFLLNTSYFLFLMRFNKHRFRYNFARKCLTSTNIDQFIAPSETTLWRKKRSKLKDKTCIQQTLPRNFPLEYWVRVRGSIIIFGILNSSFAVSIFFLLLFVLIDRKKEPVWSSRIIKYKYMINSFVEI
jgi:hypothetical protein